MINWWMSEPQILEIQATKIAKVAQNVWDHYTDQKILAVRNQLYIPFRKAQPAMYCPTWKLTVGGQRLSNLFSLGSLVGTI